MMKQKRKISIETIRNVLFKSIDILLGRWHNRHCIAGCYTQAVLHIYIYQNLGVSTACINSHCNDNYSFF